VKPFCASDKMLFFVIIMLHILIYLERNVDCIEELHMSVRVFRKYYTLLLLH